MPTLSDFSKAVKQFTLPVSMDDIKKRVKAQLTGVGLQADLVDQLSNIPMKTLADYSAGVLKIEQSELGKKLNDKQRKTLSILFSVLRHSAVFEKYTGRG